MRMLVTGGAGFIGSHVIDFFSKDNDVLVIDDLSVGKKYNIPDNVELLEVDITSDVAVEKVKDFKPDILIHLAAQKNVRVSLEQPVLDARTNITGALAIFDAACKSGVQKIVFASTAGVYASEQTFPITEDGIVAPMSPYGIAKLATEYYLEYFGQHYGICTTSLRFANVYGPRQDPKGEAGVIAIFFENLLNNKESFIFGTGEQTRDFVYVDDIVEAINLVIQNNVSGLMNIGTSNEISVKDLYSLQARIVGVDIDPVHRDSVAGEIMRSVLSNEKIIKKLNWKPDTNLEIGLTKTCDWFRKRS